MGVLFGGGWVGRLGAGLGLLLVPVLAAFLIAAGLGLFSTPHAERLFALLAGAGAEASRLVASGWAALLALHLLLLVVKLATRRTFRIPGAQWLHLVSGLALPVLLLPFAVDLHLAAGVFGPRPAPMAPLAGYWQGPGGPLVAALLVLAWLHACIGIRARLRTLAAWPALLPWATGLAVLLPAFALAGFAASGIRVAALPDAVLADPGPLPARLAREAVAAWLALLLLALLVNLLRRVLAQRHPVEISFAEGPKVTGRRGMTLLEIAQANDVPHVALCGGQGRCTTCRVVVERGADRLSPMTEDERALLASIAAPANSRLACQAHALGNVAVFRVYDVKRGRARAHASTGIERQMVVLFLDMRGFTARVSGKLPYDVVYLLNRFFDAVIPAVTEHGGRIDKYLGDGFLAVFDLEGGVGPSCRAALEAVVAIDAALVRFNAQLAQERQPPLRIGMGLHVGALVQGEIGAAGNAPVTIIGDTVNTAARLENMSKLLSAQALVSRAVLEAAGVTVPAVGWQQLDLRGVAGGVQALPLRSGAELIPFLASARVPRAG